MHDSCSSKRVEEAAAFDNLYTCEGARVHTNSSSGFLSNVVQHKIILDKISGQQQTTIGLDGAMVDEGTTRLQSSSDGHESRHGIVTKHGLMVVALDVVVLKCLGCLNEHFMSE